MIVRYILPVFALVALGFAVVQMVKFQKEPPPATPSIEPAKSPYERQLAGAGIIEPETENISIGTQVPGIVEKLFVVVGKTVRPGDPLFRIDERQLQAELEVRHANLANAEAALQKLAEMPRKEELPPAEAKVAEARANLKDLQLLFERYQKLVSTSAISEEELVRRQMATVIAKAQLSKAEADLALLKAGSWQYDKLVAATAVKQAKAQVQATQVELDRLTVRAPKFRADDDSLLSENTEFKVLQVNIRPGEFVGSVSGNALIVLGRVGKLHVRVDIDENDIPRFRPALSGTAKPRGNPKQAFPITFVRVEPYVIPKKSLTGANTERVDTRVLQVIYAIDTQGEPLYVGQQMDVFLDSPEK